MSVLPWLDSHAEDDLRAAIKATNARDDKVSRDTCGICGGLGCCACDPEPFVRRSLKSQRPRLR
jgi:hypothetical protein